MTAVTSKKIKAGDVVVIRYEGPKGGPGMREMLSVTAAIVGEGLGESVALLTDGRFSGATRGLTRRRANWNWKFPTLKLRDAWRSGKLLLRVTRPECSRNMRRW